MRKKLFTFLLALVTSVGLSWATEGALSGAFAINGDGDYIAFSKGNLQYHCTNHVWQFATNQYDIIGNDNANISDSYDGWVDLFGYGTGNNPTLVNTSYSAFSTFTDWGVNAISNGGNEANLWRTLTRDEWAYLFNSRANASSKYGMATVANVPGVIVLPDVYEGSAINTDHNGWGNNIISSGDWAAYETAGAVFLPVAGYREGTTVDNLGSYGFYWSSTPEDAMFSKKLSLDQYLVEPEGYGLRYQGLSVRLVKETTPSSGSEPEPTEDAIVIVTKTKQSSYTQSTVTISCAAIGDSDGFSVSIYGDKTATITNSDASKIISKIELVPGYSESYHSYVRANGGTPASSSESLITFTNVNSNNVTLSITNEYIQIKEVRITLADNDGPAPASNPHGECGAQGDNLLWELDPSTGVLTITGSGAMYDWTSDTDRPWYSLRAQITSVVLPSGITSLGKYAFRGTDIVSINMTENYPAGLTTINQEAFFSTQLTSVTIPESVVTIGMDAFRESKTITDVYCYADPNNLTWNDYWCDDFKNADHATVCHVKACALSTYEAKWGGTPYNVYNSTGVNVTFVGDLPGDCPAPTPTGEQVPTNADPENPSYHYSTFFHSTQNYKLSNDGTQAFIADLSNNELVLTEIAHGEQVIPANTAVILRKTGSADPVVLIPTQENGVIINPDDNSLRGVDEETTLVSLSINPLQCYVLSGKSHDETESGVGFYLIYGNSLRAHKAYVIFAGGSNNAPKKMRFVYGQATGIEDVQGNNVQSTKVIENGVLYIIRDGKTYNAMGQMVK